MIIILIGYMGSGKSSVGKNLSKTLNMEFVDLDQFIENNEDMSIPEIFQSKGEVYFRKKEHFYLKELLQMDNCILSLGGGTPCYGANMDAILNADHAKSIYLKSSLISLVDRLKNGKQSRPLISHLKKDEELTEFIGKHLFERAFYYNQSKIVLTTDGKSIDQITQEIVSRLS